MVAASQGLMATSPVFAIVVLSVLVIYMIFGVIGSFLYVRSQGPSDDRDRAQDQLYDDDRFTCRDRDDDSYWFMGFYNNAADSALYASTSFTRRGMNLGQPLGLAIMIVVILIFGVVDVLAIVAVAS